MWAVFTVALTFSSKAAPAETNAFSAAAREFDASLFNLSEKHFANFVATYTNSVHRPLAILYQARSRFYQSNYVGTIELLQQNITNANGQLDQYQFWIAESLFYK